MPILPRRFVAADALCATAGVSVAATVGVLPIVVVVLVSLSAVAVLVIMAWLIAAVELGSGVLGLPAPWRSVPPGVACRSQR